MHAQTKYSFHVFTIIVVIKQSKKHEKKSPPLSTHLPVQITVASSFSVRIMKRPLIYHYQWQTFSSPLALQRRQSVLSTTQQDGKFVAHH